MYQILWDFRISRQSFQIYLYYWRVHPVNLHRINLFIVVNKHHLFLFRNWHVWCWKELGVIQSGFPTTGIIRWTKLNCPPRVAPGLKGWSEMGSWFKQGKAVFSEILVYVPIIKSCEDDSGFHRKEPAWEGNQMSQEYQWEEQEKVLKLFVLHSLPTRMRQATLALPRPTPILKSIFLIH